MTMKSRERAYRNPENKNASVFPAVKTTEKLVGVAGFEPASSGKHSLAKCFSTTTTGVLLRADILVASLQRQRLNVLGAARQGPKTGCTPGCRVFRFLCGRGVRRNVSQI
jgi:hypothetical protein